MSRCWVVFVVALLNIPSSALAVHGGDAHLEREPSKTATAFEPHVRAGVNVGASSGYSNQADSEFDGIKVGGGPMVEWSPVRRLGLRSGVLWRPSGAGYTPGIPEYSDGSMRLDYLAVPVGIAYTHRPESRVPVRLMSTFEIARLIEATASSRYDGREREYDLTDQFAKWDTALTLGLAVPVSRSLEVALEHRWGLRELDEGGVWENVRYGAFWLSATAWFVLGGAGTE